MRALDYGLPGKPGYTYTRPFDYFAFQATMSTANTFENILTRGLLYGAATGGHDNILRGDAALTWRIRGPHAVSLRYLWSRRDASSPELGNRSQTRGTVGLFYTYLGHQRFGAVQW